MSLNNESVKNNLCNQKDLKVGAIGAGHADHEGKTAERGKKGETMGKRFVDLLNGMKRFLAGLGDW